MAGFLVCRAVVTSKFGKVLIAIRDAEARTRFLGYRVESYKLFVFTLTACMPASPARSTCRRSASSIRRIRARQFHRGGDLGRGRRPRPR